MIGAIVLGLIFHNNQAQDTKPELLDERIGTVTYQLVLTADYGGYGVSGQDLGSGTKTEVYNISNGDIFYEPDMGGIWVMNFEEPEDEEYDDVYRFFYPTKILEINELGDTYATIKTNGRNRRNGKHEEVETSLNYGEEIQIDSNSVVFDGINYVYKIMILKN